MDPKPNLDHKPTIHEAEPPVSLPWRQSTDVPSDGVGVAGRLYNIYMDFLTYLLLSIEGVSQETHYSTLRKSRNLLYLWGEGLRDGKLDKALSYSDDLEESVIELLISIGSPLCHKLTEASDFKSIFSSQPSQAPQQDIESKIDELQILLDEASAGEDDERGRGCIPQEICLEDEIPESTVQEILSDILSYVECLMSLLPSLEKTLISLDANSYDTKNRLHVENQKSAVSIGARQFVQSIFEKFPRADRNFVERLGEFSWQRHLKLQEDIRHLTRDVSKSQDSGSGSASLSSDKFIKRKSSVPARLSPTVTFASSLNENEDGPLRVPSLPRELRHDNQFTCKFCNRLLDSIGNRRDWILHVYDDIQPYVCTFAGCKDKSITYPTRALWANHQRTEHFLKTSWFCFECNNKFDNYSALESHFQELHDFGTEILQLRQILKGCNTQELELAMNQKCPFCLEVTGNTWRGFEKHVGRHMESIALSVLPLDDDDLDSIEPDPGDTNPTISYPDKTGIHTFLGPPNSLEEKKNSDLKKDKIIKKLHEHVDSLLREEAEAVMKAKDVAEKAAADAQAMAKRQTERLKALDELPMEKAKLTYINFKDALNRKFSFPFERCKTWEGMESLIRDAFDHVDVLGPLVAQRNYDLMGANENIILPQIWEAVIEPGQSISMHMWPLPDPPRKSVPLQLPNRKEAGPTLMSGGRIGKATLPPSPPHSSEAIIWHMKDPPKSKQRLKGVFKSVSQKVKWLSGKDSIPFSSSSTSLDED